MRAPELKARPRDSLRSQRWAAAEPHGPEKRLSSGWGQGPGTIPSDLAQGPCPSARSFCHLLPKRRQCCQGLRPPGAALGGRRGAQQDGIRSCWPVMTGEHHAGGWWGLFAASQGPAHLPRGSLGPGDWNSLAAGAATAPRSSESHSPPNSD